MTRRGIRKLYYFCSGYHFCLSDLGTTPVYFAAQEGQVETLKYLIVECQVDGRAKSNDGMQPIHAATQNGRAHAVKVG